MVRKLIWLVLLGLIAGVGAFAHLSYFAQQPLALPATPFEFTVQPGQSLRQVARHLTQAGLLQEPYRFVLTARLLEKTTSIKAGDYELTQALPPTQLLDKMIRGEVKQVSVTFIEGHSFAQMRKVLDEHPDLTHTTKALPEAELLSLVGASEQHAEGLFFPETYRFHKGASDVEILKRAYQDMQTHLARLWQTRDAGVPLKTPYEALVLASVVEKETGRAVERPQIAAVFVNRLNINMRLQTDPTVIYGLGETFDGNLTKVHLKTDTPYNTYTRSGLPPTPIAAPSLGALQAALQPAKGPWLYFVSRGDGTHFFSSTLAEHNKAVAQYQK
jgi:UPF0755 protein